MRLAQSEAPTAFSVPRGLKVRISIYSGRVFRFEAGHHSEMKPAAIPINFRPGF